MIRLSCRSVIRAACALAASLWALPAAAADYALAPGQQVVGGFGQYVTKDGDLFADLARHFDLGFPELVAANPGVDPWLPGAGRAVTIPGAIVLPNAPQRGIVVNLGQWRVFYFPPGGGQVETHPIGLGVVGAKTPLGVTKVVRKEPHPTWYPPASIRAEEPDLPAFVPPGPNNPLGDYALHLGWPSYLLHGTNKPDGVGRNVSHGCIRLYPEDIQHLFAAVAIGTPVRVVNQPATAGWYGNTLYLAVYPTKAQVFQLDTSKPVARDPARGVEAVVRAAAGTDAVIDWNAVRQAAVQRNAMAVRVGERSAPVAAAPAAAAPAGMPPGVVPGNADDGASPASAADAGSGPPSGVMPDNADDGQFPSMQPAEAASQMPPGVIPDPAQDTSPAADATEQ